MCNHARLAQLQWLAQHPMSEIRRLHHGTMSRGNHWIQSCQLPETPSHSEFHPLKSAQTRTKESLWEHSIRLHLVRRECGHTMSTVRPDGYKTIKETPMTPVAAEHAGYYIPWSIMQVRYKKVIWWYSARFDHPCFCTYQTSYPCRPDDQKEHSKTVEETMLVVNPAFDKQGAITVLSSKAAQKYCFMFESWTRFFFPQRAHRMKKLHYRNKQHGPKASAQNGKPNYCCSQDEAKHIHICMGHWLLFASVARHTCSWEVREKACQLPISGYRTGNHCSLGS